MDLLPTTDWKEKERKRPRRGFTEFLADTNTELEARLIDLQDDLMSRPAIAWLTARFRTATIAAVNLASLAGWWFSAMSDRLRKRFPAWDAYQARVRRRALLGVESAAKAYATMSWARVSVLTVLLLALIATIDMALGYLPSFKLIYVLPIWLAARLGGAGSGLFSMLLVGAVLTYTDAQLGPSSASNALEFAVRFIGLGGFLISVLHVESALRHARQMATLDPLTGLVNRATVEDMARDAISRCNGKPNCLHVAIIDCDRFKELNDRNGHAFGDHALKVLARRLTAGVKGLGAVGRLGGDEFVVLFHDVERGQAETALAKTNLNFKRIMASLGVSSSISFGVATCGSDGTDFDELCRVADERMFARKRTRQAAVWMSEQSSERLAS